MSNEATYREINLGRVTGLSSYELAIKNGTFEGTEEEYTRKEQKIYDDVVEIKEEIEGTYADIRKVANHMGNRVNFLGYINEPLIINTIYATYKSSDYIDRDRRGSITYTFSTETGLYMGNEVDETHGVQMRLSWTDGIDFRYKNGEETWSDWKSGVYQPNIDTSDIRTSED